jgi:hypothetical protein
MRRAALFTALLLCLGVPAFACLHPPRTFDGSIVQTGQSAVILWNKGTEVLLLRPDIKLTKGKSLPETLAWVVPLPAVPAAYSVAKADVIRETAKAWQIAQDARTPQPDSLSNARSARPKSQELSESIELLAPVKAGDYAIQPIKTKGPESVPALNAWLRENGFVEVPAENMRYYVERDWVWLAVKVALKGKGDTSSLEPLMTTFHSERIVYPLKFSSHQGVFDVNLFVVSERPLGGMKGTMDWSHASPSEKRSPLAPFRFRGTGFQAALPAALKPVQEKASKSGYEPLTGKIHLTRLWAKAVNGPKNRVEDWEEDFSLRPGR